MVALWILGGLLCLLILICMIPVRAVAVYDKGVDFTVQIAFYKLKPLEPKKKPNPKQEKKSSKKKKKERPKPDFQMVKSGVTTLLPVVLKTLKRLGKGVRFKPFQATFTIAGADDPAGAAIFYGKANGLLWSVMPQLEAEGDFQKVGLGLDVDYQAKEPVATCHIGVSITIGRALAIAAGLAVPAIQWYQGYQKEHTQPAEKAVA